MLYESIGQGWIFLFLFFIGMGIGLFECVGLNIFIFVKKSLKNTKKIEKISKNNEKSIIFTKNKPNKKTKNKKTKNIFVGVFYCLKILFLMIVLYIIVYNIDYGNMRFYHIFAFFVGFFVFKSLFANMLKNRNNCANI